MTTETKQRIASHVSGVLGEHVGIAVLAAIEVSKKRWTDADTKEYGTLSRDILQEED